MDVVGWSGHLEQGQLTTSFWPCLFGPAAEYSCSLQAQQEARDPGT